MRDVLWPRCARCHRAADVKPDRNGKLWAECCGTHVAVRLAFVTVDARPLKLNDERKGRVA